MKYTWHHPWWKRKRRKYRRKWFFPVARIYTRLLCVCVCSHRKRKLMTRQTIKYEVRCSKRVPASTLIMPLHSVWYSSCMHILFAHSIQSHALPFALPFKRCIAVIVSLSFNSFASHFSFAFVKSSEFLRTDFGQLLWKWSRSDAKFRIHEIGWNNDMAIWGNFYII